MARYTATHYLLVCFVFLFATAAVATQLVQQTGCAYVNGPIQVTHFPHIKEGTPFSYVSCPAGWLAVSASVFSMSSSSPVPVPVVGFWYPVLNATGTPQRGVSGGSATTCSYLVRGQNDQYISFSINVLCCSPSQISIVGSSNCITV